MIKFTQHIPNFCEGFDPYHIECNTTEELINHPRIKSWKEFDSRDFFKFSINNNALIAEYDNGTYWWVVGYIDGEVDLPQWNHGVYVCLDEEGNTVKIPAKDVYSSCGDEVTLRDKRILKAVW